MEYYKNIEDMLTDQFKATGKPLSGKDWKVLKADDLGEKLKPYNSLQQYSARNIDYEELKNEIIENNWFRGERKYAAKLLWAIRKKNFDKVKQFLAFGKDAIHAIRNLNHYDALKNFGFEDFKFDKHGWLNRPDWQNKETIQFGDNSNSITIGVGINGKWAYGLQYTNINGGAGMGINEWMKPLNNKEEAIEKGIETIKQFHTRALADPSIPQKSKTISKEVLQYIKEYANPIQSSLFDDISSTNITKETLAMENIQEETIEDIESQIPKSDLFLNADNNFFQKADNIQIGDDFLLKDHTSVYIVKNITEQPNGNDTIHLCGMCEHDGKIQLSKDQLINQIEFLLTDAEKEKLLDKEIDKAYDLLAGEDNPSAAKSISERINMLEKKLKENKEHLDKGLSLTTKEIERLRAEDLITDTEKEEWLNDKKKDTRPDYEKGEGQEKYERCSLKQDNMTQEKFNKLYSEFKEIGSHLLFDNVDFKKMKFTHPDGNIDYCIGFCNGITPYENEYFPEKINDCNNIEDLINHLKNSTALLDDTKLSYFEQQSNNPDANPLNDIDRDDDFTNSLIEGITNHQKKTNHSQSKTNTMEQKNLDYLANQVKYLGFGEDQKENLQKQMEAGEQKFNLTIKQQYDGYPVNYTLHFNKSNESDMYFLNSYDAAMANGRMQSIYLDKGKGFTAKETFNLMQGRAIYKELRNKKDGTNFNAWIKLAEADGENVNNSRKINIFNENYGYDLEQELAKHPIKELSNEGEKEKLIASLHKGNRQAVTFQTEGKEERKFIEANPKWKSLEIYNKDGKRMFIPHPKKDKSGISSAVPNQRPIQKVTPDEKKSAGIRR